MWSVLCKAKHKKYVGSHFDSPNVYYYSSDSLPSEGKITASGVIKNKYPEEEEDSATAKPNVKRFKLDENEEAESELKESFCHKGSENLSETLETPKDVCSHDCKTAKSCNTPSVLQDGKFDMLI